MNNFLISTSSHYLSDLKENTIHQELSLTADIEVGLLKRCAPLSFRLKCCCSFPQQGPVTYSAISQSDVGIVSTLFSGPL